MIAIENGVVIAPEGLIRDGVVLVEGEKIRAVGPREAVEMPDGARRMDAGGGHVVPGFVDMHIHGALGHDLMSATRAELEAITGFLAKHGVTAWVPAIVTAPIDEILRALDLARTILSGPRLVGAEILGVHVEGPYINPEMKGAHRLDAIHDPVPEEYAALLEYSDIIAWVTLALSCPVRSS